MTDPVLAPEGVDPGATVQPAPESPAAVEFRSEVTVELVRASAHDSDVLFAARVSTKGEQSLEDVDADASRSQGLLNYLMRDRHGCYDAETEVLTADGWRPWPEVTGAERFATLAPSGAIEYQWAMGSVDEPYEGPMLRVRTGQVDLLVTPDHRVWAARGTTGDWKLVPARDLLTERHRLAVGGGTWMPAELPRMPVARSALLGLYVVTAGADDPDHGPACVLRSPGQVAALTRWADACRLSVDHQGDRYVLSADEELRALLKRCRLDEGSLALPREVLAGTSESLEAVLDGLVVGAGQFVGDDVRLGITSAELAGQVQEIALKTGRAASIATAPSDGRDPVRHHVMLVKSRPPQLVGGDAGGVTVVPYRGRVHCVSVPNRTLYVRRGGRALWCGNSPFEHTSMTFYVHAPIFVFRELMRHRMASYNEESGRYRELRPVFYVPGRDRRLVQQGKPGHYRFLDGTPEQHALVETETRAACERAYAAYQRMLAAGVAREVARIVLPVTIYSSAYVTLNARSLMNVLSLRTKREEARFPSFPQREIEMVAERMEEEWTRLMPLTSAAFQHNGRVAP